MKNLILLSCFASFLFSSVAFAKNKPEPKLSEISYSAYRVYEWNNDGQKHITVISNVESPSNDKVYTLLEYSNKMHMYLDPEYKSQVGSYIYKNVIEIEEATGNVLLRRDNKPTMIIGKIQGKVDDKKGKISLEKNITAQFVHSRTERFLDCSAKLIDTCLFKLKPATMKLYNFELLVGNEKVFVQTNK